MTVILEPAWWWRCASCGRGCFARSMLYVPTSAEEERDVMLRLGVIEDWEETPAEGYLLTAPTKVRCGKCGHEEEVAEPLP